MNQLITAPAVSQFLCQQWQKNIEAPICKSNQGHLGAFAVVSFVAYHLIAIEGVIETVTRLALGVLLIGFAFCISDRNFIEYVDKQISFLNSESKLFIAARFTSYAICVPWQRLIRFFSKTPTTQRAATPMEPSTSQGQLLRNRGPSRLPPTVPAGLPKGNAEAIAQYGIRGASQRRYSEPGKLPSHHARGDSLTLSVSSLPGGDAPSMEALEDEALPGIHQRQRTDVSYVSAVSDGGVESGAV